METMLWIMGCAIGPFLTWCVYCLMFGIEAGCMNPVSVFKGVWTDVEFDQMLDRLFSADDFRFDEYNVRGCGIRVWVANGYSHLSFNGIMGHSYLQKRRFFRRFYKAALPGVKEAHEQGGE